MRARLVSNLSARATRANGPSRPLTCARWDASYLLRAFTTAPPPTPATSASPQPPPTPAPRPKPTSTPNPPASHPTPQTAHDPPSPKPRALPTLSNLTTYWTTLPPTPPQLSYADHFFLSSTPTFLFSVAHFRDFPRSAVPEVAFLGRSNVGKSSLLNALMQRTGKKGRLAMVSKRPGRTRTMNCFGVGGGGGGFKDRKGAQGRDGKEVERWVGRGGVVVVDMPGYGKGSREEWGEEIVKYLTQRKQLRRVFLLVDAEHGVKKGDEQLLGILRERGVPHQVVLSKVDKIVWPNAKMPGPESMERRVERLREVMEEVRRVVQPEGFRGPQALGEIVATSSEKAFVPGKKIGIDALRWAVLSAAGLESDAKGKKRDLTDEVIDVEAEVADEWR